MTKLARNPGIEIHSVQGIPALKQCNFKPWDSLPRERKQGIPVQGTGSLLRINEALKGQGHEIKSGAVRFA